MSLSPVSGLSSDKIKISTHFYIKYTASRISIHWSITGRFTEPVSHTIVLIFLLAISASNTICMHCIHIV